MCAERLCKSKNFFLLGNACLNTKSFTLTVLKYLQPLVSSLLIILLEKNFGICFASRPLPSLLADCSSIYVLRITHLIQLSINSPQCGESVNLFILRKMNNHFNLLC